MDVVLEVADYLVFDKAWAKLVPLSGALRLDNATASAGQALRETNWLSAAADALPSSLRPPSPLLVASSLSLSSSSSSTPIISSSSSVLGDSLLEVSAWPRDYIIRQILSLSTLTIVGIVLLYTLFAAVSYFLIFDHRMMRHPRFLKHQVRMEIMCSLKSFPGMTLLTLPWFLGEVRGYSRLYKSVDEYGWAYFLGSIPLFLLFTDYCIYWIHRWLHIPFLYKHIHKPHHKWIIPTPFASHAFHPVDGYAQSVPYHLFIFLFPMHQYLYLGLFVAVNFWSIFIHDSDMLVSAGSKVEKYINTPAHHTLHHLYFTCNYGQYFTWADRSGGSYRAPQEDLDPILEVLALDKKGAAVNAQETEAIKESKKSK